MHLERMASIFDFYYYKKIKKRRKYEKELFLDDPLWELRKQILNYYKSQSVKDKYLKDAIKYIRKEGMSVFPYHFREKYKKSDIVVYSDSESGMNYVKHDNKNLYFPPDMDEKDVQTVYSSLLVEQDPQSPHRYLSEEFNIDPDSILMDIGAAEGILSLDLVEKVHKVFLFEVDERWIKALSKTFEPWKEKIVIINKYVSDIDNETSVKLDTLKSQFDRNSIFLKLDVEGAEEKVLKGAQDILTSDKYNCKSAICTYHNQKDYDTLSRLMTNFGYNVEATDGYMLFIYDPHISAPYFRKGLIRCQR